MKQSSLELLSSSLEVDVEKGTHEIGIERLSHSKAISNRTLFSQLLPSTLEVYLDKEKHEIKIVSLEAISSKTRFCKMRFSRATTLHVRGRF